MGKIVLMMGVSLDGFVARPNGDLDWHLITEEWHREINELLRPSGAYLEGRVTHLMMADYWPTADQDPDASPAIREYAEIFREKRKYVFSTTLERVAYGNATLVREVDPDWINQLKSETDGDIFISGATLAHTFMRLDLIDEYRLHLHPVAIGEGQSLFPPDIEIHLELVETKPYDNGVVTLRYRPRR